MVLLISNCRTSGCCRFCGVVVWHMRFVVPPSWSVLAALEYSRFSFSTQQENSYLYFTFSHPSVSERGRKEQLVGSTVWTGWDDKMKPYADVRINIFNKVISCLVPTFILLRNEFKVRRKLDILWRDKSSGMSSFLIISINQFQLFYPYYTLANQVFGPLVCCS